LEDAYTEILTLNFFGLEEGVAYSGLVEGIRYIAFGVSGIMISKVYFSHCYCYVCILVFFLDYSMVLLTF
jgi:hypothetical protein